MDVPIAQTLASALNHAAAAQGYENSLINGTSTASGGPGAAGDAVHALAAYRRCLVLLDGVVGTSDMNLVTGGGGGAQTLDLETRTRLLGLRSRYIGRGTFVSAYCQTRPYLPQNNTCSRRASRGHHCRGTGGRVQRDGVRAPELGRRSNDCGKGKGKGGGGRRRRVCERRRRRRLRGVLCARGGHARRGCGRQRDCAASVVGCCSHDDDDGDDDDDADAGTAAAVAGHAAGGDPRVAGCVGCVGCVGRVVGVAAPRHPAAHLAAAAVRRRAPRGPRAEVRGPRLARLGLLGDTHAARPRVAQAVGRNRPLA
ncbi:hypothetical protein HK100_007985, partial [Physocladia obscura]